MDLFLEITNTPKTLHVIESLQSSTATADATVDATATAADDNSNSIVCACVFQVCVFGGGGWHQGWLRYALVMGFQHVSCNGLDKTTGTQQRGDERDGASNICDYSNDLRWKYVTFCGMLTIGHADDDSAVCVSER